MKLSVKWLAGLAILVFSVVAYAGLSTSSDVSAAADGFVYVTNSKSTLTTEASPPTGRKYSASVYSTYANTGTRNIEDEYDWMIVTVTDADLNVTSVVSDNGPTDFSTSYGGNTSNIHQVETFIRLFQMAGMAPTHLRSSWLMV